MKDPFGNEMLSFGQQLVAFVPTYLFLEGLWF
ncbi:hypothetical protein KCTC52924_03271 [Arenibacter antarcticus]